MAHSELREQFRLAMPLAVGYLGNQLMGVVDTAMLGRYSETALAGVGIANGIYFAISVLGLGVIMGLDTLVPQALGAGKPERARALMHQGIRLALIAGIPLGVGATLAPLFLPVAGVEQAICQEAWQYALWRAPGVLPFLVGAVLRSYLQAISVTRPMVIAMIIGNLVNAVADGLLIFGDAGLARIGLPEIGMPALGAPGAAVATTLVVTLTAGVYALALRTASPGQGGVPQPRARPDDRGRRRLSRYEPEIMARIVRIGLPVGLQLFAEVGIFTLVGVLAGRLGAVSAAAHQIALTGASFTFSMALGVSAATSVRVGLAVGAGQSMRARQAGLTGLRLGFGLMSISALTFLFFPRQLTSLFTSDQSIIVATVPLFRIAAVFQLSDGAQSILAGALRGAGDTRATLWANLLGYYVIALSLSAVLAFGLDLGAPGLWWGLSAGLTSVAIILILRFLWLTGRPIAPSE